MTLREMVSGVIQALKRINRRIGEIEAAKFYGSKDKADQVKPKRQPKPASTQ